MTYIDRVLEEYRQKDYREPEFIQAVEEVLKTTSCIFEKHPEYEDMAILERLLEPERIIQFKVTWIDDRGKVRVNRGYRIQFNGALGPYKGGLRFNKSVNISILKFLAFEQVFKNSLTGLFIGGAKGGSDFDPKDKSDNEILNFCTNFMSELYRHIGPDVDVPAGDMGVSAKEIGYLYGYYRRLKAASESGVLTGKPLSYGGSLVRKEATGFGLIYFIDHLLAHNNMNLENKRCIISGAGNVAIYAALKAKEKNMKVVGMSDSRGYIIDEDLDITTIKKIKEDLKLSLKEYIKLKNRGQYFEGSIYDHKIKYDIALPCGTQNEINLARAKKLVENGCLLVGEGANMPTDNQSLEYLLKNKVLLAPAKAANAGGVATSALEMSQNSIRYRWTFEEVDKKLQDIMQEIFNKCLQAIDEYDLNKNDFVAAANIAGMQRVIEAMISQGRY